MAEKTDGWAGKKNGGLGEEKKRPVRVAKKTDFEVGKKNGGEVKKKNGRWLVNNSPTAISALLYPSTQR